MKSPSKCDKRINLNIKRHSFQREFNIHENGKREFTNEIQSYPQIVQRMGKTLKSGERYELKTICH